jgi:hypothetical protein
MLGETYIWFLFVLIPRALWPGKPDYGSFGQQFGILTDVSSTGATSIGATMLGEAWLNFGPLGVMAFMGFFGAINAAMYYCLRRRYSSPPLGATWLYIMLYVLAVKDFESIFVMVFGPILQLTLFVAVIDRLLLRQALTGSKQGGTAPTSIGQLVQTVSRPAR